METLSFEQAKSQVVSEGTSFWSFVEYTDKRYADGAIVGLYPWPDADEEGLEGEDRVCVHINEGRWSPHNDTGGGEYYDLSDDMPLPLALDSLLWARGDVNDLSYELLFWSTMELLGKDIPALMSKYDVSDSKMPALPAMPDFGGAGSLGAATR